MIIFITIIIIIIIIIITLSFIQSIHTHIPETNHVPRGYIVAVILSLSFMVPLFLVPALVLLFFYVSTFRSMCAVPNMVVFCLLLLLFHFQVLILSHEDLLILKNTSSPYDFILCAS
jgi:hypothetical protein